MNFYFYLIIAFLIGSIPFGLIWSLVFGCGDIRIRGSGNIGATNVYRVVGPAAAFLTVVGDIGKGVVAVYLARLWFHSAWPVDFDSALVIGGVAAILGHVFSPYLKFKGGKGVNTALGVFIILAPLEILIALFSFIVIVLISRFISLGSITAAIVFALIIWSEKLVMGKDISWVLAGVAAFVAIFIIYTHRSNIKRLLSGQENRFNLRRSKS